MWKYLLLILLDSILLQPFRIVFGFLARFCWHPPKIMKATPYTDAESLFLHADKLYSTLDRNKYGMDDDSAKFLGMLAYVRPDTEFSKFKELVTSAGDLKRNLKIFYPVNTPEFSTDMLSGFMLGAYGNLSRMTEDDKLLFTKVWEKASWEGFPMLVSSLNKGKRVFGRGHIYRFWWIFGSEEILMALAWLALGRKITGYKKYTFAYWVTLILLFPSLFFSCPDAQLFLKRVYWLSAHNTHSRVLINTVGYLLTNSIWFKLALKIANKRHGKYNADIQALYLHALARKGKLYSTEEVLALVNSAKNKGTLNISDKHKYLSLGFPPKIVTNASSLLTPTLRGNDYVWERSPLYGYVNTEEYRQAHGLDVIFPMKILAKILLDNNDI